MSTENRDPLDNTTVDDPSFALNCNVNVDDFELERTIVRQRQTAIYNQIVRDAANCNSSSGAAAVPPAAAAAAAPVESAPPAAAAAAAAAEAPSEFNCPSHRVHIVRGSFLQPPDLLEVITNHLQNLEWHHLDPALARAAARAAVTVIAAARMDPATREAVDRAEAERQVLLAEMAAVAAELPAVAAAVAAEPSEPPAAAAAAAPEPSEPPAAAAAAAAPTAKATGKKRKRPTEEAKEQDKETRKNKTVRIEGKCEYEWVYDDDFEGPFRVIKLQKKSEETE